jgi:hypothetical protein
MNIKIPDLNQIPLQSDIEMQAKTQGWIKQKADFNPIYALEIYTGC